MAKAERRRFTAEYKRRIVREAEGCTKPGEIGALLRREALYSSHLVTWRAARDRGELAGLSPKKRGPKVAPPDPRDKRIAEQEREIARWQKRAERAEAFVEVQKKSRRCWGRRSRARSDDRDGAGGRAGSAERAGVLEIVHEPRFVDLAPAQIFAQLLDEQRFVCSERTMYRILAANQEVRERGTSEWCLYALKES